MRLTTNFQVLPEIDVYKPVPITYGEPHEEWLVNSPEHYQEVLSGMKERPSPTKMRPAISMEIDRKIDNLIQGKEKYTDDQWRHLHIIRFPGKASVINYTKDDINIQGIPVVKWETRVYKAYTEVDGRDKLICLTPGVLMIRHLWCDKDPSALMVVHQILNETGVKDRRYHGDVEVDGKKVMGAMNTPISDNRMGTDGIITFDYDEGIFSKLPVEFYSRSYHSYKKKGEQGISGLIQEIPGFNINQFLTELIERLGYGKTPIQEIIDKGIDIHSDKAAGI